MKDEIKEILDKLLEYFKESNINDFGYEKDKLISYEEAQILLDYITNLQEKVNQYENPDDLTLFYMWLDVKAKDKMKQLQEENERLKELCDKYEEEHNTTFQKWLKELKGGEK